MQASLTSERERLVAQEQQLTAALRENDSLTQRVRKLEAVAANLEAVQEMLKSTQGALLVYTSLWFDYLGVFCETGLCVY